VHPISRNVERATHFSLAKSYNSVITLSFKLVITLSFKLVITLSCKLVIILSRKVCVHLVESCGSPSWKVSFVLRQRPRRSPWRGMRLSKLRTCSTEGHFWKEENYL
jgi:hypothetical protein